MLVLCSLGSARPCAQHCAVSPRPRLAFWETKLAAAAIFSSGSAQPGTLRAEQAWNQSALSGCGDCN